MSLKLGAWLLLGVSLVRCAPDFDSLSSGADVAGGVVGQASGGTATNAGGSSGSAGDAGNLGGETSGGVATSTGGSSAGGAGNGDRGGSTNQGGQTQNAAGTTEPVGGASSAGATGEGAAAGDAATASGGEEASGGEGAGGGQGATGGEGGTPSEPCEFLHPGAIRYNGFDGGLDGNGFTSATTTTTVVTTLGTTATSQWDAMAGRSCPGSLHMEAQFKGYASGTASDESAIVDLHFSQADWTGAVELRAWVKVEPAAAPLGSLQFFVLSGNAFLYAAAYDNVRFRSGQWTEMVLSLSPEANLDPGRVLRIGVELWLQRQGEGTNPPLSAPIHIWLDDVWVK